MEKVKITREQEKWIGIHKSQEISLDRYFEDHDNWVRNYKPLSTLNQLELSLALNGWYEVEEPFQVGEWVRRKKDDKYFKIRSWNTLDNIIKNVETFEKVTEPWKIALLEIGREKPELKVGDKYQMKSECQSFTIETNYLKGAAIERFEEGLVKYFYPVESRIEMN